MMQTCASAIIVVSEAPAAFSATYTGSLDCFVIPVSCFTAHWGYYRVKGACPLKVLKLHSDGRG